MDQGQAASLSQKLAAAWVDWNDNSDAHENRAYENSVQEAAFNLCFDFLPEDGTAAVFRDGDDPPVIGALAGDRLYLVRVDKPGEGESPALMQCELYPVDPRRATAVCRTKFYGTRTGAAPLRRETVWAFNLGVQGLGFTTHVPREGPFPPEEALAQTLAAAIGWTEFPPDAR